MGNTKREKHDCMCYFLMDKQAQVYKDKIKKTKLKSK